MFASVLERNLPPRQFGRGAALTLGVHAGIIAAVVLLSARVVPARSKDLPAMKRYVPTRYVELDSKPTHSGEPSRRASSDRRAMRAAAPDVERTKKRAPETSSSLATTNDAHAGASDETGHDEGPPANSGGGSGSGTPGPSAGGTTIAIPCARRYEQAFGEGMQRPALLSHPAPVYTREASAAHASGVVIAKCVITLEGTLRQCRIVRGVAHMDAAVLDALSQWRYSPVMFQGHPVSVEYTINLRLVAP